MLTEQTIAIVKATAPIVAPHAEAITHGAFVSQVRKHDTREF